MSEARNLRATIISFASMQEHGTLFANLLKARRDSFVIKNSWELPTAEGMEFDQYDNPASRWIAIHDGDKVLAGIRLTPTTARVGMYTYMIRDAQRGLIDSISTNLLNFDAPVDPDIWESSRVFVVESVPAKLRTRVQLMMMEKMMVAAEELGAKIVIGLVPAVWSRWIGRLGLKAEPAGPVLDIDGWKTQVALMHLDDAYTVREVASEDGGRPRLVHDATKPDPDSNVIPLKSEAPRAAGR